MPFQITCQNMRSIKVDAVVKLESAWCFGKKHGLYENSCEAEITEARGFSAEFVIHVAMPADASQSKGEEHKLTLVYVRALMLAKENHMGSVAVPAFWENGSKEACLKAAVSAVKVFLSKNEMNICLVTEDRSSVSFSRKKLDNIVCYIKNKGKIYGQSFSEAFEEHDFLPEDFKEQLSEEANAVWESVCPYEAQKLEVLLDNMPESFNEMLIRYIDEKGKRDTEVYKGANIDRRLFSKIRSDTSYNPKKSTVLALAVSLELSLEETRDLLARAGYALSMSRKADVIVQYFIEHGEYDLFSINETLFFFGQPLLGSVSK